MTQERNFLDEITANPEYRMARLVYADWLDEKGDARGELIRIEEEMFSVPIWADRYWQLKPRRNELRAQCTKKWLDWMNYGNHYEPVFREVPIGWNERWRLLREFCERWHGVPMPDLGGQADAIAAIEKDHNVVLASSFREWIAFARDLQARNSFGKVMRDGFVVEDLTEAAGDRALTLMLQTEGDVYWAVFKRNLNEVDPPVAMYVFNDDDFDDRPFILARNAESSLMSFVFGHMMAYLHGAGGGFSTRVNDIDSLRLRLSTAFPVEARIGNFSIFERQDMIAVLGADHFSDQVRLHVELSKPLPREDVPAFLWEYTRNGGSFHGMFAPDPIR